MKESTRGKTLIIISAIIFGLMPLGARLAYRGGSNAYQLVFCRYFLVLPIYYFLARSSGMSLKISKIELLKVQFLGLSSSLALVSLYMSYNYINTGLATTLHFMYPLFVILGCWLFYRERPGLKIWLALFLTLLGLFLNMPRGSAASQGVFLALLSALIFAVYVVYLPKSKLGKLGTFVLFFHINLAGALQIGLITSLLSSWSPMNRLGIISSLLFALVVSYAALSFQRGTLMIGPQRAAIFSTLEPLTSIVSGIFILGDGISPLSALGLAFILLSSLLLSLD